MALMMSALLAHDDRLPRVARDALRAATESSSAAGRAEALQSAARILYDETELDCAEVRDLLDLPADCGCH